MVMTAPSGSQGWEPTLRETGCGVSGLRWDGREAGSVGGEEPSHGGADGVRDCRRVVPPPGEGMALVYVELEAAGHGDPLPGRRALGTGVRGGVHQRAPGAEGPRHASPRGRFLARERQPVGER